MHATITHSPGHRAARALAQTLAAALDLWCVPLQAGMQRHAPMIVAPAAERRHHDPVTTVVVVPSGRNVRLGVQGRIVLCGIQDNADAPAAATAAAIAEALDLQLVLAHVIPPASVAVPGPVAAPTVGRLTVEDRAHARETIGRVAHAAGLDGPGTAARRVLCGSPGPTLATVARAEDAALVVVSASLRTALVRVLLGSATSHLVRRSDRPIVVCPRDPRAAMRVREALSSSSTHAWWNR